MQLPVDYLICFGDPQKTIAFQMHEARWDKTMLNETDYRAIMRVLIGAFFATDSIAITKSTAPCRAADLTSYDIVQKLGSTRLRELAESNTGRVSAWLLQEAEILDLD